MSQSLSELLKIANTGLSLEISENLAKLDTIAKTHLDAYRKLQEKYKHKRGKEAVQYQVDLQDGKPQIMFDPKGRPLEGVGPGGSTSLIDPKKQVAFNGEMKLLFDKEYSFSPTIIKKADIQNLCNTGVINSFDFSGLIRFGIIK